MSGFSANTIKPLVAALPANEMHELHEFLTKLLKPKTAKVKKKKDIYDKVGDIYRPENRELLIYEITHS